MAAATPVAAARHSAFRPWSRIIGVLLLGVLVQSCTAVKLGYNNLPELVYWWFDGYIDFTDAQAPRMREDLDALHRWHRTQELPKTIALLQKTELIAAADIAPEQACAIFSEVRGQIQTVMTEFEPALTLLALDFTAPQLDHLRKKYAKKNAEYRSDWIEGTLERRRERRFDQVVERSEMFYGRLDIAQRALIRQQVETSSFSPTASLTEQERRQEEILQVFGQTMLSGASMVEARQAIHRLFEHQLESPDPVFRKYAQQLQQEGCSSFALLHRTATPAQRSKAIKKLQSYQRDLAELVAQR